MTTREQPAATPGPEPAGRASTGQDQDWHALYLELGTVASTYIRVSEAVQRGEADGGEFWEAFSNFSTLVGQAICWRDIPEEYAAALARQRAARSAAGRTGREGEGE